MNDSKAQIKAAIKTACEILGSQSAMAKSLGLSVPTINEWVQGDRPVPHRFILTIEKLTGGQVSRRDLAPDSWHEYWPESAGNKQSKKAKAVKA
jgi:DNA-binding transcriptional regulator YdaS (Cro superfamily)